MDSYRGVRIGNVVDCEGGSVVSGSYTEATAFDKNGKVIKQFAGPDRHMQNFIDVVRNRRTSDLYGPVDEGHVSSALCHLGNMSHRLGAATPEGEIREQVKGNAALAEAHGRMIEHLRANNVDLGQTPLTLGAPIAFDPMTEQLTDPNMRIRLAAMEPAYRAPYLVPSITV
jgi:hypothetical protein